MGTSDYNTNATPQQPITIDGHDVKIFTRDIESKALGQIRELLGIDVFADKKYG